MLYEKGTVVRTVCILYIMYEVLRYDTLQYCGVYYMLHFNLDLSSIGSDFVEFDKMQDFTITQLHLSGQL